MFSAMTGSKNHRIPHTLWSLLTLSLLVSVVPASRASAAPPIATVVSTSELELRSCPTLQCQVIERLPLGAQVEVIDEGPGSFLQVEHDAVTGYASNLYLATDPDNVPYLVEGEPGCQRVAWIFNIGVGFEPASGILDTLEEEQVSATMFVMGWWASEHPEILKRIVDEGYPIGSHGNWPQELTGLSDSDVVTDLENAADAIEHATGKPPAPLFTPYAAASDERVRAIVAATGNLNVGWEVPAADYGADATEDGVYGRVMDEIYDGAIAELHLDGPASAESTGRALPLLVRDLRAQGYRFVTIPEMAEPCP